MNERLNDTVPFVQQLSRVLQNLEEVCRPFMQALDRIFETVGPPFLELVKYEKFLTSIEKTGWLPHRMVPRSLVDDCGEDSSLLESRLSEFYQTKWPDIHQDIESRLEGYCISDEAKAAFREALAAHEYGLYRCVSRTLFPEIDRALRIHFFEDKAKSISSGTMLNTFMNQGSLAEFMPAEAHGWALLGRLMNHLFTNVTDRNREAVAQDDLPTRHASLHGLIDYSTYKQSFNMIVMTDYIFQVLTRLDKPSEPSQ